MHTPITISQQGVECVPHFHYLGSYICIDGDTTVDVRARIAKAASVFQRLHPIWSSKSINMSVKLCLYKSNVMPTATYAGETWHTIVKIVNKLYVFHHRRCLRTIHGISCQKRGSTEKSTDGKSPGHCKEEKMKICWTNPVPSTRTDSITCQVTDPRKREEGPTKKNPERI